MYWQKQSTCGCWYFPWAFCSDWPTTSAFLAFEWPLTVKSHATVQLKGLPAILGDPLAAIDSYSEPIGCYCWSNQSWESQFRVVTNRPSDCHCSKKGSPSCEMKIRSTSDLMVSNSDSNLHQPNQSLLTCSTNYSPDFHLRSSEAASADLMGSLKFDAQRSYLGLLWLLPLHFRFLLQEWCPELAQYSPQH